MDGQRLTHSQIKPIRDSLLAAQGGKCALCRTPIKSTDKPVLDHCHNTGAVRGTLHHSCNAVLGKIENSYVRFGLSRMLFEFLAGVGSYMMRHSKGNVTGYIYPTHLTEEEKRIKRNAKAVKVRAAARLQRKPA